VLLLVYISEGVLNPTSLSGAGGQYILKIGAGPEPALGLVVRT